MGRVMLCVKRNGTTHYLHFYVAKSCVTPILGRDSCLGMQLINSDAIYSGRTVNDAKGIFLDRISEMSLKVLANCRGSTQYRLPMMCCL